MGHRKKHAPKRGSLSYLPKGRAAHEVGRIRFWPKVNNGPILLAFAGYKAGMTYALVIEDKNRSPDFGKEVVYPSTILDVPPLRICAIKAYISENTGLRTFGEAWTSSLPKDFRRIIGIPTDFNQEKSLAKMDEKIEDISEIRVQVATQPRLAAISKKKPDLMEIKIGGGILGEQYEYAKSILGKTIGVETIFREGQFVDVISVSKGKGWQGPVKRWGIRIRHHKSNKTKRGVGTLGPWKPPRVRYTVPRAGQMGYHQRTEYNKRVLKIGKNGTEITPKGGFLRYGNVKGPYLMLKGSIPGPSKRIVRLRYPARGLRRTSGKPPEISYISLESPQGA